MARLRFVVILLPFLLAACQWNHRFSLEDLGQLEIGRSTRDDVERLLGTCELLLKTSYSSSERDGVIPFFPLVFHAHDVRYEFRAWFDEQNVLKSGMLEIVEESRTSVLLFFGTATFAVHLDDVELEAVRKLQNKGIEIRIALSPVRCFGGVIGWDTISLDEYLRRKCS